MTAISFVQQGKWVPETCTDRYTACCTPLFQGGQHKFPSRSSDSKLGRIGPRGQLSCAPERETGEAGSPECAQKVIFLVCKILCHRRQVFYFFLFTFCHTSILIFFKCYPLHMIRSIRLCLRLYLTILTKKIKICIVMGGLKERERWSCAQQMH